MFHSISLATRHVQLSIRAVWIEIKESLLVLWWKVSWLCCSVYSPRNMALISQSRVVRTSLTQPWVPFLSLVLLCYVCCPSVSGACMRVRDPALPIQRFDLIFKAKQSAGPSARVGVLLLLSLCLRPPHSALQSLISPAPKLLNSCWWPTRCRLWSRNILRCRLLWFAVVKHSAPNTALSFWYNKFRCS